MRVYAHHLVSDGFSNLVVMRVLCRLFVAVIASAILISCTDFEGPSFEGLNVSPGTVSIGKAGGDISISVQAAGVWDMSVPSWVKRTIDNTNFRSFRWTVNLHFEKNTGYDRTGTVDFRMGSIKRSVTVMQQGDKGEYVPVTGVELDYSSLSLRVGESVSLNAVVLPNIASVKTITWTSNNKAVASVTPLGQYVTQTGNVVGNSVGIAEIIATTEDGNKTATCNVTVMEAETPVTSISLDKTSLSLTVGNTYSLTASVLPTNATDRTVTWTSSNTAVAVVSSSGVIHARDAGTATITAKTNNDMTVTCVVTVSSASVPVTSVGLSKSYMSMTIGETQTLTATVYPTSATNKEVSWSSSNTSVATVSPSGLVTAKSAGTASISVKTSDGNKTATCTVTVSAATVPVSSVSLNTTSLSMTVDDKQTLTATVYPTNATNKAVTWSSNNTAVATVSSSGTVTAKAAGTAIITVKTNDGNKSASCSVTVSAATIPVTSISLNKTSLSMSVGETQMLTATVLPSNATNQAVNWSSSNSLVATVSSIGLVTAIAAGSATITVTSSDGAKTAFCTVAVSESASGSENGHEYVDLGLPSGLKWATCNIGANSPEGYGDYFAWGEIAPKSNYDWSTYSFCDGSYNKLTRYNTKSLYGPVVDNKTTLEFSDDAARENWQGKWRIPTQAEFNELINSNNCSTQWITQNGVKGRKITSKKNGNSIFLPAAGESLYDTGSSGSYWSSSLDTDGPLQAWLLSFDSGNLSVGNNGRCRGFTVRPVTGQGLVVDVTGVSLNKSTTTLTVGETESLIATVSPSNATNQAVTWSSDNTSVATVSSSGIVTAKAVGVTTITVKTNDGNKIAACSVTVQAATISVSGVTLNKSKLTMTIGDSQTLTATVTPSNATNKSVTWSTSNSAVATVSTSGVVTAKAAGTAVITVRTIDGNKAADCNVTVQDAIVPVTGVCLNYDTAELSVGNRLTLTAEITPSNATNKDVSWSSSNSSVATVSSSGNVIAKSKGETTITVISIDGGKTATCRIIVNTWITGNDNGHEWVDLGLPSGLKWASGNIGATSFDECGMYFAWGETFSKTNYDWTSYSWCNGESKSLTKYCLEAESGIVDNRTILEIQDDAAHALWGGNWRLPTQEEVDELLANCTTTYVLLGDNKIPSLMLTSKKYDGCIILPFAGAMDGRNRINYGEYGLYWTSSLFSLYSMRAEYYSISSSGTTSYNYYRYIGFPIRPVTDKDVRIPVTGISLSRSVLTLAEGESSSLSTTVTPSNATQPNVIWSSNNQSVAIVDYEGNITAVSAGSAIITARTYDGNKTATCTVNVTSTNVPVTSVSLNNTSLSMMVLKHRR